MLGKNKSMTLFPDKCIQLYIYQYNLGISLSRFIGWGSNGGGTVMKPFSPRKDSSQGGHDEGNNLGT